MKWLGVIVTHQPTRGQASTAAVYPDVFAKGNEWQLLSIVSGRHLRGEGAKRERRLLEYKKSTGNYFVMLISYSVVPFAATN